MRINLPKIELRAHDGVKFRLPDRAVALWDKTILAAKSQSDAVISILSPIYPGTEGEGVFSVEMLMAQLTAAEKRPLTLNINSPGGSYFEGVTIFNLLRDYPNRITVNVLGEAASAASVVAMAGDRIRIYQGALMMIHSASGLAIGNKQDLRDLAAVLEKVDNVVADVYAARTGQTREKILEMMEAETWMTPEECVKAGFAHEIVKEQKGSTPAKASKATAHAAIGNYRAAAVMHAKPSPGASGKEIDLAALDSRSPVISFKGAVMQTTQERISALEAKRAATVAQMEAITTKVSEESRVMDDAEIEQFDMLDTDVKQIDSQLVRDKRMAELAMSAARQITPAAGVDGAAAAQARQPAGSGVRVYANIEKGIPFARYAMAMVQAEGNRQLALSMVQQNKRWMDQTPQVAQFLMTAVGAGTRTGSGWADDLVYATNLTSDFVDLVRPMTIVGRIPNIRRVPFNIRVGTKTTGTTGYWVGEGKPIPMSKFGTGVLTLDRHKLAGLTSITEELALDSSPSAELSVRDDLRASIVELMDESFIDPDRAEVSGVSPASVTNGVTPVQPTGTTADHLRADLKTLLDKFATANLSTAGGVFITTQSIANTLMFMTNALGQQEFPEFNARDGMANLRGYPLIISQSALATSSPTGGNLIIFLLPREVMLADDGEVDVRVSREASIEMADNPGQDAVAGTGASLVSMYQTDSLAIRAIRFVSWKKRRTDAVHFINDAEYAP